VNAPGKGWRPAIRQIPSRKHQKQQRAAAVQNLAGQYGTFEQFELVRKELRGYAPKDNNKLPGPNLYVQGGWRANRQLKLISESMKAAAQYIGSLFPCLMMTASLSSIAAPPGIESQPQGRTVILHQPLAIAVTASGSEPLAYQWRKGGLPIPGATNDHILFPDAQFSDAGLYSVVVSNAEDSVTSAEAALIVKSPFGGDIDFSWAWGGWANMPVQAIALQADGKILMAGGFFAPGAPGPSGGWIARLTVDGAIDRSFINPISTVDSVRTDGLIQSVQVQVDGKVLIGGLFRTVNGVSRTNIARLNANGSLDNSFGSALSGTDGLVQSIAVQNDGKVLIGGYFTTINGISRNRIGRLNADGTLDTSFGGDGLSGADGPVRTVAVQSDGKVLIGGQFSAVNGVSRVGIARLNADGSLDSGFEAGVAGPAPLNFAVNSISVQNDGRVLIAGYFQTVNGVSRGNVARLNDDGTLDSGFGNELSGTDGVVQSIVVQTNGMVLIGGNFIRSATSPAVTWRD
jgi:uncharacterized delta-60 repeat protein